jgi:predicted nucleic acid-binding Zn ribbon protein
MNENLEQKPKKHLNGFSGFCAYCNTPISNDKFCSEECAEEFELATKFGLFNKQHKY